MRRLVMRRSTLVLCLAGCSIASAASAQDPGARDGTAQESAARGPAGYDASPLLAHLRESERAALTARLDVVRLEDLPLYDLHLAIDDELRGFGLRETIVVTNVERTPLSEIVLRVFANAVGPAGEAPLVSMLAGRCLDGASCTVEQSAPSVLRVRLAAPIAHGAHVRVELDLQGRTRTIDPQRTTMMAQGLESMSGMAGGAASGAGDYGLLARSERVACFASFFAVLARRESGRWIVDDGGTVGDLGTDEMANVSARIVLPRAMQIVSTGVETQSLPVRDVAGRAPRREITVQAGVVRDFAFLAGELESSAREVGGVTVRSSYRATERVAGQRVQDVAASALEIFERRFGPYPYTELDVVEAPLVGGAGGVEFSGLVTIASMFYQPSGMGGLGGGAMDAEAMQRSMIEFVTAHEVAHQWWHGIVGSDSRDHPWVDESLAQWSAMLWVEERYGAARAQEEGERQVAMNYRAMRMMGHADAAVDRPASAFGAPMAYAGLVYGKGPYLYREIRSALGDEAFFTGLRAYVARWRYRVAPDRGPIDALATGSHARRVRALARRWLDERHGDEDLGGSGDPMSMLGSMLPPEMRDRLQDPAVQSMLRQMMGGMDGAADGDIDAAGDSEGGSPASIQERMQELEQMLGQLPDSSSP